MRNRKSIRLAGYDYSSTGAYFVTICAVEHKCLLGKIENQKIILSNIGKMAQNCWLEIPDHFPDVKINSFVIMPNHVHGIILINNTVGVQNFEPLQNKFQHIVPKSLGSIVRGYKIGVTKWCKQNNYNYFQWQRNYYEHIIRDENELNRIGEYIINNHLNWESDIENIVAGNSRTALFNTNYYKKIIEDKKFQNQ